MIQGFLLRQPLHHAFVQHGNRLRGLAIDKQIRHTSLAMRADGVFELEFRARGEPAPVGSVMFAGSRVPNRAQKMKTTMSDWAGRGICSWKFAVARNGSCSQKTDSIRRKAANSACKRSTTCCASRRSSPTSPREEKKILNALTGMLPRPGVSRTTPPQP